MKKIHIIGVIILLFLLSCANIFNGVVLTNHCKKCEVLNSHTNEVLFTNEGCGSENTNLEEEAKIEAYDLSRYGNICNLEVVCTTWKQEDAPKE